jgi:hypothetical protein
MADQLNRLTKSTGFTIADIIKSSWKYYKSKDGDNKDRRAKLDVKSVKIVARKNWEYNRSTGGWEQTGRDVKIEFLVRSVPISYKKTDSIATHIYPVTFLIHSIELGVNSTFKWRTGGLKKPVFKNPSLSAEQIANKNIKAGCQMQFIYESMFLLKKHNLLYGRNYTSRPPRVTNPLNKIFFDKHAWACIKILTRVIGTDGGLIKGVVFKNSDMFKTKKK